MAKRTASQVGKSNVNRSKTHERKVAEYLEEWTGTPFMRRIVTGRDANTIMFSLTGDVVCVEHQIKFNLEAKAGANFSLTALVSNPETNIFTKWYHQSTYDANLSTERHGYKVYPMVFFRPGTGLNWVGVSKTGLETMKPRVIGSVYDFPHISYDWYGKSGPITHNVSHTGNRKNKVFIPLDLDPCILCSWKDFAAHIDPESIFRHVRVQPINDDTTGQERTSQSSATDRVCSEDCSDDSAERRPCTKEEGCSQNSEDKS